jgi:hypothetical protein
MDGDTIFYDPYFGGDFIIDAGEYKIVHNYVIKYNESTEQIVDSIYLSDYEFLFPRTTANGKYLITFNKYRSTIFLWETAQFKTTLYLSKELGGNTDVKASEDGLCVMRKKDTSLKNRLNIG